MFVTGSYGKKMEEHKQWAREEAKQTKWEEEEEGLEIEGEVGGGMGWQWGASCPASLGQGRLEMMLRKGKDDPLQDTQDFGLHGGHAGATMMLSFKIFSSPRILSGAKTSP
jgi:hypothetical protein